MTKKILLAAVIATICSNTALAERVNKNIEAGSYGKIAATYFDEKDEYIYEDSHINGYMAYHFNRTTQVKLDFGVRSILDENGEYDYGIYADEAYYKFTENKTSSIVLGRFFNPVGLHGESTRNYKDHPFTARANTITSIDGVGLNYLGKLQKNVFFDLNVFVGTTLSDIKVDNYEIDLDPQINYGANVEVAGAAGSINFGLYSSSNGEDLKINGVKPSNDTSYFYQSNIGYEFSRNNIYFLAEYNRYELNYDDDIKNIKDNIDATLAFKVGNAMPMIGYSYEKNEGLFQVHPTTTKRDIAKAGLRYAFNKNLSLLTEYEYVMPESDDGHKMENDHVVSLGLTFNY